ncbi:hypothetical protein ACJIZ3_010233 [Penstemon smallii]|uniref:BZIP domain-containing protein n=1 Tax=Penstemon smallii TaxID=265156 RepID=A0ABD3TFE1_9LAMI
MSGADEEWVKSAMKDDTMAAELLVHLHRTSPPLKPLEWSVRQRRSNPKKPSHRGSPTTPLSWSGATSLSGGSGGVGIEESSRPSPLKLSNTTRSKFNVDSEKTAFKRSRKKKTLSELKEEENLLIKERRDLKREIASLRLNLEKESDTNVSLKKMKLELQPHLDKGTTYVPEESISGQLLGKIPSIIPQIVSGNYNTLQPSIASNGDVPSDPPFVLPDLNLPFEDSSSDVICGVS